jgi:hypothetical protein
MLQSQGSFLIPSAISTSDATPKTILSTPVKSKQMVSILLRVNGMRHNAQDSFCAFIRFCVLRRPGNNVVIMGTPNIDKYFSTAGLLVNATCSIDKNFNAIIQVVGESNQPWDWIADYRCLYSQIIP